MTTNNMHLYKFIKWLDVVVKVSLPKGINIQIETVSVFTVTNSIRHFHGSRPWSQHTTVSTRTTEQDMPSLSYVSNSVTDPRDMYLDQAVNTLYINNTFHTALLF